MLRVTSLHQFSLSDQLEQIKSYWNKPQKFNHEVSEHILYSLYNSILGVLQSGKLPSIFVLCCPYRVEH